MPKRTRLLAWLAGTALVVGAVIALRATDETAGGSGADAKPPPVHVKRYGADNVVLPSAGRPPAPPERIVVTPDTGLLRLSWADGLAGGTAPADVAGYEVRWHRDEKPDEPAVRLVATPDVQLEGLANGRRYRVAVRSVDAFGQRSEPAEVLGVPGPAERPWVAELTGLYDDFADPNTARENSPRSRWHLSGDHGCVGLGTERASGRGLPIDLGCGGDMAVLRARAPLRLTAPWDADGELGRVAVRTDTAGPGGELTVDLTPGRPDRAGVGQQRAARTGETDPALPGGTIRVSVSDSGVRVGTAPDLVGAPPTVEVHPAPRRGPGVAHLFEVVLTTSGVHVYQDGLAIAARAVVPAWRQASVLLGFRGPEGRRSRVHVAAAGFTGPPAPVSGVVEAPVRTGSRRVLGLGDQEPDIGIARTPLRAARAARVVATMAVAPGLDPNGVVVQLGDIRLPAHPVMAVPPTATGAALTVAADVPAALLGDRGPDALKPFVVRARGASAQVSLLETYLEITPEPGWTGPESAPIAMPRRPDPLPVVDAELGNAAGDPLTSLTVPRRGQLVLTVAMEAAHVQWDTGTVGGVQGLEVRLDGELIAGVPTTRDGPGVGGRYAFSIAVGGLKVGQHAIEVREYGMSGERHESDLLTFAVRR